MNGINLTGKIVPKNDAFIGLVDAKHVIGGTDNVLPISVMPQFESSDSSIIITRGATSINFTQNNGSINSSKIFEQEESPNPPVQGMRWLDITSGIKYEYVNGAWVELGPNPILIVDQSGTSDYSILFNKPSINGIELNGNKSLLELGLEPARSINDNYITDLEKLNLHTHLNKSLLDNYNPNNFATAAQGSKADTALQSLPQDIVIDSQYNRFTIAEKLKLESLFNYDDFLIVQQLENKVNIESDKSLVHNSEIDKLLTVQFNAQPNDPHTVIDANYVHTDNNLTNELISLINSAIQEESDPTVPAWAKSAVKPSYTYDEVGAAPALNIGDNYITDEEKINLHTHPNKTELDNFNPDNFAANDHTHEYLPLSGGMITGNLSAANLSGNNTGDEKYNNLLPTSTSIGGIPAGSIFNNKSMQEMFDSLLYPTLNPTITAPSSTFTISATNGYYEVGQNLSSITFNSSFNRGSINPAYGTSGFRSGLPSRYNYSGLNLSNVLSNSLSNSVTINNYIVLPGSNIWSGSVNFLEGEQPKNNKGDNFSTPLPAGTTSTINRSFIGIYPFLFGMSESILNSNNIYSNLSNKLIQVQGNKNVTLDGNLMYIYFIFPSTMADLVSIIDQNGFNVTSAFQKITMDVTSAGLANNWTVSYKVYRTINKTSVSNGLYQFRFN